jgi:hypothetical protein
MESTTSETQTARLRAFHYLTIRGRREEGEEEETVADVYRSVHQIMDTAARSLEVEAEEEVVEVQEEEEE